MSPLLTSIPKSVLGEVFQGCPFQVISPQTDTILVPSLRYQLYCRARKGMPLILTVRLCGSQGRAWWIGLLSARAHCPASLPSRESRMPVRILIADDDSTIRMLLRRLLERHRDWQVCCEAVNGVEAIERVEQAAPDLAILDLAMPVMNGMQAAQWISKLNPQLPMLLISVQEVSDQLVRAAQQAGFKGAITKSRGPEVIQGVEALLNNEVFFRRDCSTNVW